MKNLVNRNLDEFLEEGCGTPRTKKEKEKKLEKVSKKVFAGKQKTNTGKKLNPKSEKDRKQGLAIAYSEAGLSKNK
jgi:hypothetical protein